jgi:Na+/H+ antiporter NhaD/arsenite permease-like protein
LLVALQGSDHMSLGMWAWLSGVNVGAVLTPIGALANLLWWRILGDEGESMSVSRYMRVVVPIAVPALLAAAAVMGVERLVLG